MKIAYGITGSVATTVAVKMVDKLITAGHEIQLIATASAFYFFDTKTLSIPIWSEKDEWPGERYVKDQDIKHIELREWADLLLIAPITANTMAKMAFGFADNLLTCVIRAWDINKPIVLAPAMNTQMWIKCQTEEHLSRISQIYQAKIIDPIAKKLACGEIGIGAMANIDDIVKAVNKFA